MKSEFLLAFNQICSDRGLSSEVVIEALQMALVSAYRRNVGGNANQNTPGDFGRIAAQNAKQIILQRIREAEREARYKHYVQQEGEIIHGTVQSIKPQAVTLHIEGTEAILPRRQQVPGERYSLHQRLRAYVLEVRKTGRGPQITVSRSHKNMLRRLLELEVPEIFNGAVEIKSIAREAGSRSKVAVAARQPGVDPVGACVGMRGVRIQSIVNELGGEKIDVIEWSPDTATFIAKALSPAKVLSVQLEEDPVGGKTAKVVVPDDQLSLAIGRAGQNARLAAKLTTWRIDIQGVTEAATSALRRVNEDPNVLPALGLVAELLPAVAGTLRQHEREKLPYTSEELLNMRQVIEAVGRYYASIRNAERARLIEEEMARRAAIEAAETERRAVIEAARARILPRAYEIPLAEMGLSTRVLGHLERAGLVTAGEVMERFAEGDEGLLKLDGVGPKSLAEVKRAIKALALAEAEEAIPAEEEAAVEAETALPAEPAPEAPAEAEEPLAAEEIEAKEEEPALEVTLEAEAPEALEEAVPEKVVVTEEAPAKEFVAAEASAEEGVTVEEAPPVAAKEEGTTPEVTPESLEKPPVEEKVAEEPPIVMAVPEVLLKEEQTQEKLEEERRRERRLRRQLVYDEELGTVVALRRRKRGQEFNEWDEFEE